MSRDLREKRLFTYTSFHEEIDSVNIRVLEELQRDPRLTMSELGRRIGMSSPAVTERVRRRPPRLLLLPAERLGPVVVPEGADRHAAVVGIAAVAHQLELALVVGVRADVGPFALLACLSLTGCDKVKSLINRKKPTPPATKVALRIDAPRPWPLRMCQPPH